MITSPHDIATCRYYAAAPEAPSLLAAASSVLKEARHRSSHIFAIDAGRRHCAFISSSRLLTPRAHFPVIRLPSRPLAILLGFLADKSRAFSGAFYADAISREATRHAHCRIPGKATRRRSPRSMPYAEATCAFFSRSQKASPASMRISSRGFQRHAITGRRFDLVSPRCRIMHAAPPSRQPTSPSFPLMKEHARRPEQAAAATPPLHKQHIFSITARHSGAERLTARQVRAAMLYRAARQPCRAASPTAVTREVEAAAISCIVAEHSFRALFRYRRRSLVEAPPLLLRLLLASREILSTSRRFRAGLR